MTSVLSMPFLKSELVDSLFVVIHNIVAETAIVSRKMLNDTCLEWNIELSPNFPSIILRYELKSDERVRMIPVTDYQLAHENSGTVDDTNIIDHKSIVIVDERSGIKYASYNLKQELPELLLVENDNEEIDDKSVENIHTNNQKSTSFETKVSIGSISGSMNNFNESVNTSHERELNSVTDSDSNIATLQIEEEEQGTCDDNDRWIGTSKQITNDNGIGTNKGKVYSRVYFEKSFSKWRKKQGHERKCKREIPNESGESENIFNRIDDQNDYETINTRRKCFRCRLCNKSFTSSVDLIRHKIIHTGEKILKCDVCCKSFTRSYHLKSHKRIHTGEKPFKCDVCAKSFARLDALKCHRRIHTGEKPFACLQCGSSFSHSSTLIKHKRIHMAEKPFKCEICGKSFAQSGSLNYHKSIHTGEKPFKCVTCCKGFFYQCHLFQHQKTHK